MWIFLIINLFFINKVFTQPINQTQPLYAQVPVNYNYNSNATTPASIIYQYDTNNPDGSFNNTYETSNGIKVENQGYVKNVEIPQQTDPNGKLIDAHQETIIVQIGSYSFIDPSGNVYSVQYIADENGFQPTGDHLPTPPSASQSSDQIIQGQPISNVARAIRPSYQGIGTSVSNRPSYQQPIYQGQQLGASVTNTPSYQSQQLGATVVNRPSYSGQQLGQAVSNTPSYQGQQLGSTITTQPQFGSSIDNRPPGLQFGSTIGHRPSYLGQNPYYQNDNVDQNIRQTRNPSEVFEETL